MKRACNQRRVTLPESCGIRRPRIRVCEVARSMSWIMRSESGLLPTVASMDENSKLLRVPGIASCQRCLGVLPEDFGVGLITVLYYCSSQNPSRLVHFELADRALPMQGPILSCRWHSSCLPLGSLSALPTSIRYLSHIAYSTFNPQRPVQHADCLISAPVRCSKSALNTRITLKENPWAVHWQCHWCKRYTYLVLSYKKIFTCLAAGRLHK
jgi:hypothetical protein